MRVKDRIIHAWNAFTNDRWRADKGPSSSRPVYKTVNYFSPSSYVSSIYNKIAVDASMTNFHHVKVNKEENTMDIIDSGLNNCLTLEANIDQSHYQFMHDLVYSLFDEGVVAAVPVETNISPMETGGYDILNMRVGQIVNWFPKHVEIRLYNDNTGQNENIIMEKKHVAIIENPLYAVVNGENSTLKRLIRKLNQLDNVEALVDSGRLDLLISVPYAIKTETQRKMAEDRIADIEAQLSLGRNGIAYIDGTEKVIQLNRPANDQLIETINALANEFHNQLGLTQNVFNGTASETELRAYYTRTIDPIIEYITAEYKRKFLTKTARTQGHTIRYYRNMFKMIPAETVVKLGDSLIRNEIATGNEVREIIGMFPSKDPKANELFNPNISADKQAGGIGDFANAEEPAMQDDGEE